MTKNEEWKGGTETAGEGSQQHQDAPAPNSGERDPMPDPLASGNGQGGAGENVELEGETESQTDASGQMETPAEELDPVSLLTAEVEKWKDIALRSQADLDNFRKRAARERQDSIRYANGTLLEALFPILDSFEMGLEAARGESEESMVYQGMQMVFNQLRTFLQDLGVTEVEAEGKEFDPKLHDAVSQEASSVVPEGGIIRVMRRGYRLSDRLLRAPAVVVSTGEGEGES